MIRKIIILLLLQLVVVANVFASTDSKLIDAVKSRNLALLNDLIATGININQEDASGQSPLHHACFLGYLEIVKTLISNGADVNKNVPKLKLTPLHGASMSRNLKVVKYLIEHGAKVDSKEQEGATPLLSACWVGSLDIVKCLVENGASIHEKTVYGATALHFACQSNNLELVLFLIKGGCDINSQALNGATPLHLAAALGNISIVRALLVKGAKKNFKMKWDSTFTFCRKAPILEDKDAINITFIEGRTPLDVARDRGNNEIVDLIANAEQ